MRKRNLISRSLFLMSPKIMICNQVANFEMNWQLFEVKSKTFVFKNQQLRRTQYSVIDPWYKSKQNKEVLEKWTKILFHTTKTREFSICRVSKSSIFQARKQELVSRGKRPESPTVKNSSCFQKCLMVYNMVLTFVHYS